jgi:putative flippase GtrA
MIVGLLSVGTDLAVYAGLLAAGLSTPAAKGLGYLAGMAVGFVLNKTWTFGSRAPAGGEAVTYIFLYAVTFAVNIAVNSGVLTMTAGALTGFLHAATAFLVTTGLTTVLNFLGMRFITFRKGITAKRAADR